MKKKRILSYLLPGVLFICLIFWFFYQKWPDGHARIVFCDVGQGDATLITYQFYQILIDAGPNEKILDCLSQYIPFWDNTIELIVPTHGDTDHIGGFPHVLERYSTKQIVVNGYGKDTETFERFRQSIIHQTQNGAKFQIAQKGQVFRFSTLIEAKVVFPLSQIGQKEIFTSQMTETQLSDVYKKQQEQYGDVNDWCIAIFLSIGRRKILLTADLEEKGELALVQSGVLEKIDVLKAGHHGSKTSNTMNILQVLRPENVVISLGKKNKYGHPHKQSLQNFTRIGAKIFRTDLQGHIELKTDGYSLWSELSPT